MNYCPRCGAHLDAGDLFCSMCGYDVAARARSESLDFADSAAPRVFGLSLGHAYYLSGTGILDFKILTWPVALLVGVASTAIAAAVGFLLGAQSVFVYGSLWLLAFLPLLDEYRWRRVRRLQGYTLDQLSKLSQSPATPWESVGWATFNRSKRGLRCDLNSIPRSMTVQSGDVQAVEGYLRSMLGNRFGAADGRRSRLRMPSFTTTVVILFLASQAFLLLGALTPLSPGESQTYTTIYNTLENSVSGASPLQEYTLIFANNIQVALGVAFPGFGLLANAISSFNTGCIVQVISVEQGLVTPAVLTTLYLLPHTWIEELGYAVAMGGTLCYGFRWNGSRLNDLSNRLQRSSTKWVLSFAGAAILLLVADLFEVTEPFFGLGALLLWIPVAAALVAYSRRRTRV